MSGQSGSKPGEPVVGDGPVEVVVGLGVVEVVAVGLEVVEVVEVEVVELDVVDDEVEEVLGPSVVISHFTLSARLQIFRAGSYNRSPGQS